MNNRNVFKQFSTVSFLCWFVLVTVQFANAQKITVRKLQCEYAENPLGVEFARPMLSWNITSTEKNTMQTAYRILVSDDYISLQKNTGTIWDSKKVFSDQSLQVLFAGKTLASAKTYFWKVMVWDNQGNVSAWSNINKWEMGLLEITAWKSAQWIAYERMDDSLLLQPLHSEALRRPLQDILPLIRKEFFVKKKIKKATFFISGLGHFEVSINGKKTGDHFLDPGWTNYDKQALYVTFDVTDQIKNGSNAIAVLLGNGFYFMPSGRYLKLQLADGYPKMICRLAIEYADGSKENIVSNPSWKTAPGPITFSSIYGGEDYNANLEQSGWDEPFFNDASWRNAIVVDGPAAINSQTAQPLKVFQNFSAKRITQPLPAVWVYDFGQNSSGIPQISLKGKKGATVRLWPAELLDTNGTITTKPIGTPVYFDYTLKGNGIETWQPRFMYYGFRYVQVTGAIPAGKSNPQKLPEIIALKSLHTRNASERVGEFSCSNNLFNKTDVLIDWAIQNNMSSVFTDCPHREKLGWLEEAHLMGPSVNYNYNIAAFCRKVIRDMINAQTADGLIPSTAPEYAVFGGPFRDSPEWGSNSIIMPWYMYEWYGDKQILQEAYPMMQQYINYLKTKSQENILSHGLGDWYDIGTKEPGPSQLTPRGITATAFYYYDLGIVSKVATLLNEEQDANQYNEMARQVKEAYNKKFFNTSSNQYGSGSQTANAISVYMNLVEPQNRNAVVSNIVKELTDHNYRLSAGDIGYRYLLRVLDENGRSDVIYKMNSNPAVPGYGYQLSKGATALTESWQAYTNSSNDHMMLGHIKEWFFSGLAGIHQAKTSVAFKEIEIKPQPVGNITSASATYISPYGKIVSDWKKNRNIFELIAEIPPNTTAVIYLPAKQTSRITEGNKKLNTVNHVKLSGYENESAVLEIGSGTYHFKVENRN